MNPRTIMPQALLPLLALLATLALMAWPGGPARAQVGQSLGQAQPPQGVPALPGQEQAGYETIESPARFDVGDDSIELAILFWYGCPACRASDPATDAFALSLPGDVRVERLPMFFPESLGGLYAAESQAHGRLFLALEALGVEPGARQAAFDAAQTPGDPGGRGYGLLDQESQETFAAGLGLDGEGLLRALDSPPVLEREGRIKDFIGRAGLMGVPALVINGRYIIYYAHGPAFLGLAERLIESERARLAQGGASD